uniref:Uncharacterized protein n=1 Tax=Picea glauca TaxID=3330 RepID=A0A101LYI6_PICGL|nr:hypothetical protein ABT39_MTgene5868 [Picea glauca]
MRLEPNEGGPGERSQPILWRSTRPSSPTIVHRLSKRREICLPALARPC